MVSDDNIVAFVLDSDDLEEASVRENVSYLEHLRVPVGLRVRLHVLIEDLLLRLLPAR